MLCQLMTVQASSLKRSQKYKPIIYCIFSFIRDRKNIAEKFLGIWHTQTRGGREGDPCRLFFIRHFDFVFHERGKTKISSSSFVVRYHKNPFKIVSCEEASNSNIFYELTSGSYPIKLISFCKMMWKTLSRINYWLYSIFAGIYLYHSISISIDQYQSILII